METFRTWLEASSNLDQAMDELSRLLRRKSKVDWYPASESVAARFKISVEELRRSFLARQKLAHQKKLAAGGPDVTPPPEGFKTTPKEEPQKPKAVQGSLFDVIGTQYGTSVRSKR